MTHPEPNHLVTFNDGDWEVELYIDPDDLKEAIQGDGEKRSQICKAFREACAQKYGRAFANRPNRFIKWREIWISELKDTKLVSR